MANSISVRSAQFVQFNVDTNAAGGAAVSILANRQYAVVDYTYVNTSAVVTAAALSAIDTAAAPVTVALGAVNAAIANAVLRPSLTTGAGANACSLSFASNATASAFDNIVVRGGTLRISITTATATATGFVTILPGNRYGTTTSNTSYYANNTASVNNNGTVSI